MDWTCPERPTDPPDNSLSSGEQRDLDRRVLDESLDICDDAGSFHDLVLSTAMDEIESDLRLLAAPDHNPTDAELARYARRMRRALLPALNRAAHKQMEAQPC